jgi:zinc and cadmium transporter
MSEIWLYAIASTVLISLLSFSGVLFLAFQQKVLRQIIFVLISFAVGALFGNAFFILLPESYLHIPDAKLAGILVVTGLLFMFILEKFIHWRHNHSIDEEEGAHKPAPLGYISLITDGLHNFTDGVLIAAAWMVSPEVGIATTTAVLLHEIPQEISDFGVLIHAGFSRKKALMLNFFSACSAILGGVFMLILGHLTEVATYYILPVAAGGFIYLAGTDLLPELHREKSNKKNIIQFAAILAGLMLMHFISLNHSHGHNNESTGQETHVHDESCGHEETVTPELHQHSDTCNHHNHSHE